MRILAWGGDRPCSYYRAVVPLRGLQRLGLADTRVVLHAKKQPIPTPEVLVLHRNDDPWVTSIFDRLDERTLLVFDDDDDLLNIVCREYFSTPVNRGVPGLPPDPEMRAFDYIEASTRTFIRQTWPGTDLDMGDLAIKFRLAPDGMPPSVINRTRALFEAARYAKTEEQAIEWALNFQTPRVYLHSLQSADLLTVSTPALAARYRQYTAAPIHVLPNCLDFALPCYAEPAEESHEGVVIGWAGSMTHMRDFWNAGAGPAVLRLLREYDGTHGKPLLRLSIGGDVRVFLKLFRAAPGIAPFLERLIPYLAPEEWQRQIPETIDSDDGRYQFRTWCTDVDQMGYMHTGVDIGIIPNLLDAPINQCKSDIKGVEMGAVGVPSIASPLACYQEWRSDPDTGCLVLPTNGAAIWEDALRSLIEDPARRRQLGRQARAFAETRSIDRWAPKWLDVYEERARELGLPWKQVA